MSKTGNLEFNNPFMALKNKNFRLYWIGMCVSLIGTWMQNMAQPWLAYSLTDSPLLLSLVGAMQFLPMLCFSLFAGVFIDRFSKKKILLVTQSASLIITLALAILVWLGQVQYWHILIASTALGFVNTLDMPTRQAFVSELVGREYLVNAIALNSSAFNLARIFGPALAALVMGFAGIAACFYVNSISFAAVIIVLPFIKPIPVKTVRKAGQGVIEQIKDGIGYIKNNPLLRNTVLSVLVVGTFAMNLNVLVPVFTKLVLHKDETAFGFLMSSMGGGAFLGSIFVATKSKSGPSYTIMRIFPAFTALFLVLTGFSKLYFLTALGLAATGFFFVAFNSTANSLLQYNTEDQYRGRVMSVFTLVFNGSTPIGNLFSGLIAENFGASAGFIACGLTLGLLLLILAAWRFSLQKNAEQR